MRSPRFFSQLITSAIAMLLSNSYGIFPSNQLELISIPLSTQVVVEPFLVSGDTETQIRESLRHRGPIDNRGASRDAFTHWRLAWHWRLTKDQQIDPRSIKLQLDVHMRIPQLRVVPLVLEQRWRKYHQALVLHELRHAQHALWGAQELANRFQQSSKALLFAEAQDTADIILTTIRNADRSYDELTDHGFSEGIRW